MNSFPHVFYSNISKELFERLDNYFHFSTVYYSPKTKEFGKYCKESKRYYFYDFVLPDIKLCIEFNGDYFHANPKFFKECDTQKTLLLCKKSTKYFKWRCKYGE